MSFIDTLRNALGEGERFAVKVQNRDDNVHGETKWVSASPDQVKRILDILSENDDYYTLTDADVGKAFIGAFGQKWPVADFIGRVQPRDVGKRVFKHAAGHLTVENDEQCNQRLEGRRP